MKRYDFEQGTPAWLQCRAGKITASRCKDARDVLKSGKPSGKQTAYAAQVAVERIAGAPIDQTFQNWQMKEGNAQEPLCRMAYEELTGNLVEEVGAFTTDDNQFLYSPDGTVGADGLIEIKSLFSAERIVNIVGSGDTSDFIDQCMFGLWLTGRKWIDLVIWCPALASIGLDMTIIHIERDEQAIEAMEADLMAFAANVNEAEAKLRTKAAAKVASQALANAAAITAQPAQAPEMQTCLCEAEVQTSELVVHVAQPAPTTAPDPTPYLFTEAQEGAPATLRLGQISERLGFNLTADFLAGLGFEPCATDKNAKLYKARLFPSICHELVKHIQSVCELEAA